jgi:glutaconate CoA-transferase, subunit B
MADRTPDATPTEFLICLLARTIGNAASVAAGAASPLPGAAALLAQARSRGRTKAMILGSTNHGPFNDGGPELFDRAAQGRIDVFFLSGGQIDGGANINLVGTGDYPNSTMRFPGSFGASYLYFLIPRIILFREEHSRRVLVPNVDFVSAPGTSGKGIHRPGGPDALITGMAAFNFDRRKGRFRLSHTHPGNSVDDVRSKTGFQFDYSEQTPSTAAPDSKSLELLRGPVREQIAEIYPAFAADRLTR